MSNSFVESNEYLPSPDGQRSGMPSKSGPGHPLGPYAPKPVGSIVATAPDNRWLANEDGSGAGGKGIGSSANQGGKAAPAPKGQSEDVTHQMPGKVWG